MHLKHPSIKVIHSPTYNDIIENVKTKLHEGDLLLTIGAGKVNQVGEALVSMNKD